jgi:sterol desaturase/sphingolipid hydroxylase (fatty acid hydroxylase superfamily)
MAVLSPSGAAVPLRLGEAESGQELADYARLFAGRPGPRMIAGAWAVTAAVRLALGRFRRRDLATVAGMVAAQPFTEWVVHVAILHSRPRRVAGRTVDLALARHHRDHHADPKDIDRALIPVPTVVGAIGGTAALVGALGRDRNGVTAALTGFSLLLGYEWTHFLMHSAYRPRTALYRSRWRAHRLHHYKNERYWFGITSGFGDQVLRTNPDRGHVETSPTARNLAA